MMNILLVEDDAGLVELITVMLEESGFSVMSVTSGVETLTHLKKQIPDLMLLDYSLPDMNGKEVVEALHKQQTPPPPFIITTGQGDERIAVDMMKLGAMDYLVKDILFLEKLPDVIKRVVKEIERDEKLKQAEKALYQSTQLLEASQSIAKVGGWELDIATGNLFWTAETYRIHETSPEEFNPTVDAGVGYFLPESRRIISNALEVAIESGEGYDLLLETYTTKGSRIDVRTTCEVTLLDGKPTKLIGIFQDITEHKQADKALKESEERIRLFTQNVPDFLLQIDKNGKVNYINKTFEGLTQKDVIGTSVYSWIPKGFSEKFKGRVEKVFRHGGSETIEYPTEGENGEPIWFESQIGPLEKSGIITQVIIVARDITERKQAEEKLRASEEAKEINEKYYENIINSMGDPVFVKDAQSKLLLVNDAFCETFDRPRDEIIGKTLAKDVPANEWEQFLKIDKQVLLDGKDNINEEPLTLKGGKTRTVSTRKTRYTDNNGKKFLVGVIRDFTAIKKQKTELQHLRSYLANIIDSMPSVLIGIDSSDNITQWNYTAAQKTGISTENALNKPLLKVIPSLIKEIDRIHLAIHTHEVQSNPKQVYEEQGNTRCENITIYPLTTNDVEGAVIRIDDVTKEYEVELQLNQARKMDAIGQLAGGVAHDFNNMLTVIMSAAEMIPRLEQGLSDKGLESVEMILNAAHRVAGLNSKLLAFARKGNIVSTSVDIHKIIDDTVSIFNRTIDKKVKIYVSKNAENSIVEGDDSALQNSILNLGINASHAMVEGGELVIETRNIYLDEHYCNSSPFQIEQGDYIEINVRDNGCGITSENINKIFEPFFTTKNQGEGTGLGLASVYGTIQDHQGEIKVNSEMGIGTVFHIYLSCSGEEIKTEKITKPIFKGTGQVLLVDDEEFIRKTGKHSLEYMGYKVLEAKNGLEALEIFKQNHLEVQFVIMDMIMPEMNGREAFFKMKEIDDNCKVIVSSGFTKNENLNELKNAGLAGFIQKPFRIDDLSKLLVEIMRIT
ncbi:MAG: PAS domain S-box protein [Reichenbachiella sp.]